jgi:hypothetical protein
MIKPARKKHRKSIRRMTRLLERILKVTQDKHPITICAVCCAVIAIMHKRMDEDDREYSRGLIVSCLSQVTEDPAQAVKRVH